MNSSLSRRPNRQVVPIFTPRLCVAMLVAASGLTSSALAQAATPTPQPPNVSGSVAGAMGKAKPTDSLPVTRITLYRSGVGSFERRGQVSGDASVQLKFNVDQINDILKSMIVLDMGGRLESVGYGSKDPLARRLSSFGVDISDNPSMAALLTRLRGTNVTVTTTEGPVTGTILGVESREEASGASQKPISVAYLNLISSGIRSVRLADVKSFTVNDEQLAAELDKALAAMADQRADRIKTVDISTRGDMVRELVVAYVHETPVWKTSYRLVVPDANAADTKGSTKIQAWAIVENTTDEDWENVNLSLVAGQPVSFRMDLYEPLYSPRPEIPVPMAAGVMPRVYGMALEELADKTDLAAEIRGRANSPMAKSLARAESAPGSPAPMSDRAAGERLHLGAAMAGYAPAAVAHGNDEGELFRFELDAPVTIERQRSAMLPILSAGIDARRVSIYNPSDGQPHPMCGLELTNSTQMQLMPGPVSVFEGGVYAGDAQIGHIPAGDKRLLAYATDLEVGVVTKYDTSNTVRKVRIVNGVLEQTIKYVSTSDYTFTNKDQARGRTLLIEQPRMGGYELVGLKPKEITETLYRFEVTLDPGKAGSLKIPQETTGMTTLGVTDLDTRVLFEYCTSGKASEAVMNAVREIAKRRDALEAGRSRVKSLEAAWAEIEKDQSRLRQNMERLDKNSQLYAQYMQKLTTQEKKIDDLGTQMEQGREEVQRAEAELAGFIAGLNVE